MELESGDYISYTVSECRDLASVKNLFRRNCTVLLDHHPCKITKLNGSKHDLKPLISSGPSASESYFIAGFSIRMGVDIKPLKENCRLKMNYFLINLKGMESRFSNVFFACCTS